MGLVARDDLRRNVALVHRLVRQHRLPDDVADREDVRHVGPHLAVDRNVATLVDDDAGPVRADLPAIRRATDRLQDQVVPLRPGRGRLAFEGGQQAVGPSLDRHRPGLQHDAVEARRVHLLPDLDEVAVGTEHQPVEHLDDVDACAERRVDRGHLESDDAAADDQHLLRHGAQPERSGGVHDTRVIGHERQAHRRRAGRDDRGSEADDLFLPGLVLGIAARQFHLEVVGSDEAAVAAHDRDLAHLRHGAQPAGELADHLVLVCSQLVEVHLGCTELDTEAGKMGGLVHDRRDMQQRFRRDAADVQADAAQRRVTLHQDDLLSQVRCAKRCRVAARPRAEHQHIALDVGRTVKAGGLRCRRRSRCRRRRGVGADAASRALAGLWPMLPSPLARWRCSCLEPQHQRTLRDLVPQLDDQFLHDAGN